MNSSIPAGNSNSSENGSAIDWRAALSEHACWLRTVVRSRIGDAHAVDDVMQEIYLAVLKQTARPQQVAKIAPWLYRVAVRQVVNYQRSHGRQRRLATDFARQARSDAQCGESARDWLLGKERRQAIAIAMRELPPKHREILLLKYTEGWTYAQLAKRLGVKVKTVEYRLMRARAALRVSLRELDTEEKS